MIGTRYRKDSDPNNWTWFVLRLLPHPRDTEQWSLDFLPSCPKYWQGRGCWWLPCNSRSRVMEWHSKGQLCSSKLPPLREWSQPSSSPEAFSPTVILHIPAVIVFSQLWACSFFWLLASACRTAWGQPLTLPCVWAVDFQLLWQMIPSWELDLFLTRHYHFVQVGPAVTACLQWARQRGCIVLWRRALRDIWAGAIDITGQKDTSDGSATRYIIKLLPFGIKHRWIKSFPFWPFPSESQIKPVGEYAWSGSLVRALAGQEKPQQWDFSRECISGRCRLSWAGFCWASLHAVTRWSLTSQTHPGWQDGWRPQNHECTPPPKMPRTGLRPHLAVLFRVTSDNSHAGLFGISDWLHWIFYKSSHHLHLGRGGIFFF